jgi:hypothetical protein
MMSAREARPAWHEIARDTLKANSVKLVADPARLDDFPRQRTLIRSLPRTRESGSLALVPRFRADEPK